MQAVHYEKLKNVRPAVSTSRPALSTGTRARTKKEQLEEDRYLMIEQENQKLLQRMSAIMTANPHLPAPGQRGKSLNKEFRRKEQIRVMVENQALLRRLQDRQSSYSTEQWKNQRKETERLLKNICQFPYKLGSAPEEIKRQMSQPLLSGTQGVSQPDSARNRGKGQPRVLPPLKPTVPHPETVLKRGISLSDHYFLLEIQTIKDKVKLKATDFDSQDQYTLKLTRSELRNIVGDSGDRYEKLAERLALQAEGLVLIGKKNAERSDTKAKPEMNTKAKPADAQQQSLKPVLKPALTKAHPPTTKKAMPSTKSEPSLVIPPRPQPPKPKETEVDTKPIDHFPIKKEESREEGRGYDEDFNEEDKEEIKPADADRTAKLEENKQNPGQNHEGGEDEYGQDPEFRSGDPPNRHSDSESAPKSPTKPDKEQEYDEEFEEPEQVSHGVETVPKIEADKDRSEDKLKDYEEDQPGEEGGEDESLPTVSAKPVVSEDYGHTAQVQARTDSPSPPVEAVSQVEQRPPASQTPPIEPEPVLDRMKQGEESSEREDGPSDNLNGRDDDGERQEEPMLVPAAANSHESEPIPRTEIGSVLPPPVQTDPYSPKGQAELQETQPQDSVPPTHEVLPTESVPHTVPPTYEAPPTDSVLPTYEAPPTDSILPTYEAPPTESVPPTDSVLPTYEAPPTEPPTHELPAADSVPQNEPVPHTDSPQPTHSPPHTNEVGLNEVPPTNEVPPIDSVLHTDPAPPTHPLPPTDSFPELVPPTHDLSPVVPIESTPVEQPVNPTAAPLPEESHSSSHSEALGVLVPVPPQVELESHVPEATSADHIPKQDEAAPMAPSEVLPESPQRSLPPTIAPEMPTEAHSPHIKAAVREDDPSGLIQTSAGHPPSIPAEDPSFHSHPAPTEHEETTLAALPITQEPPMPDESKPVKEESKEEVPFHHESESSSQEEGSQSAGDHSSLDSPVSSHPPMAESFLPALSSSPL